MHVRGQQDQDTAEAHARIDTRSAHVLVLGVPLRSPSQIGLGSMGANVETRESRAVGIRRHDLEMYQWIYRPCLKLSFRMHDRKIKTCGIVIA